MASWVITQFSRLRPSTIPRKSECRLAAKKASNVEKVRVGMALVRRSAAYGDYTVSMGPTAFCDDKSKADPSARKGIVLPVLAQDDTQKTLYPLMVLVASSQVTTDFLK